MYSVDNFSYYKNSDNLNFLFSSRRNKIWLWLFMNHWGWSREISTFEDESSYDRMKAIIEKEKISFSIIDWFNYSIISDDLLCWMDKTDQQSRFFIKAIEKIITKPINAMLPNGELAHKDKANKLMPFTSSDPENLNHLKNGNSIIMPQWPSNGLSNLYNGLPILPNELTPWEKLVALIDFWPVRKAIKVKQLNELKLFWTHHQQQEKRLFWYSQGSDTKQKCKAAWHWYLDNHPMKAGHLPLFSKAEDVFSFLSYSGFSQEEKLHHLEQIKKKVKYQKTKANREGKKQTNTTLSDTARAQLDKLAEREKITRTKVIELLIQNAYERGMPK